MIYLSLSRVRILFNLQFFKAFISQPLRVAYITASGMISHVLNLGLSYKDFSLETFRFEDEDDYEIWLQVFFAYSQDIDTAESFILPFFTWNVSTVIFSEGGYALSRLQKDKTFNIWYLFFATTTFARTEWRWLPRLPAKMTLPPERALL